MTSLDTNKLKGRALEFVTTNQQDPIASVELLGANHQSVINTNQRPEFVHFEFQSGARMTVAKSILAQLRRHGYEWRWL